MAAYQFELNKGIFK